MNKINMTLFGFSQFNYLRQLGLGATLVITLIFFFFFVHFYFGGKHQVYM